MLNSKPSNSNYNQGNFIPKHKDKIVKLNNQGGLYYRSGLELKIMTWLDNNKNIVRWGAECLRIPYQMTHFEKGDMKIKEHCYYPDFYYEIKSGKEIKYVVCEVKPMKEYKTVMALTEGRLEVPQNDAKKLRNFEYTLKMAHQNKNKWETMIKWCDLKGYQFIIVTEEILNKLI